MQSLNSALLTSILHIADEAGKHLADFYAKSVKISMKADNTPVTEADLFISQFLTEKLQQLTPSIPVLSEEKCNIPLLKRQHWQEYWIIDPLDGTQQFIDRTDQFSIVIGLVQQNCPVLGVIHAPILDKTYFAFQNGGAYLREKEKYHLLTNSRLSMDNKMARLRITMGSINPKVLSCVRPPYEAELFQYGSSSLKAGLVAEGKADCYLRLGDTGEWDTAAAEILLSEIGGAIFDLQFQPLVYNQRETFINPHFVMVANKRLAWKTILQFN
ncbi:3'(2'),5'-bisphosphate nucleotidase [Nicoletella semolina]|uniref:3'(2'),5'-bisphosphate nucleotidase CysQ n=1 Tax=Nicoletella semolina TaxID=271160 RepID=A0A4R2NCJ1_9PAST|nr:3'(2'),5'-bisphosphate nucleotidase CysQ [Nicoletella semolina]MDH2924355.1 3'(2'),5'-bisphosphate nucleotidase CysQ [Nicoletella semolina]TCP18742.1 3'(2'),5'-bisphosphate nucleotidase [Nicoletella semolina]